MSFVKDDSSYTRGVGAVAAMDAASPRRRRAAARGAVAMARRDAIMSRHTLGRIAQVDPGDGGGGSGGGGGGGSRPVPPRPGRPVVGGRLPVFVPPKGLPPKPLPPKPVPPRFPIRDLSAIRNGKLQVKSPGSVLPPKADPLPPKAGTPITDAVTPVAPTKAPITIVAGGGAPWVPPKMTAPPPPPMPDMPEMPDVTDLPPDAPIQTAPAKPKSNLLLYAALGIGAYWLLTRKH